MGYEYKKVNNEYDYILDMLSDEGRRYIEHCIAKEEIPTFTECVEDI